MNNTSTKPIKAIFVGIRRTDPYAEKLSHFDQTDEGWPDFMRVIDWRYKNIWEFLPYCTLYNRGMENTYPNPALKDDCNGYQQACKLQNELHKRDGRKGSLNK